MSSRGSVLVVDDDRTTLTLAQALLEDAGFDVTVRDQALGTGAQIAQERPDFVVLDINMPALSGDRIAELMRARDRMGAARIVFYSGRPESELREFAERFGALGWIHKSGDHAAFVAEFEKLVASVTPRGTP